MNLGAAVLAVGVISITYDVYLQQALTEYIVDLIQLERNVSEVGLREIHEEYKFKWEPILAGASECIVLLVSPSAWINTGWPHVLAAARERLVSVEVFLPDPDGESLSALAERINAPVDQVRADSRAAYSKLRNEFTYEKGANALVTGSSLTIRYYDEPAAYSMVATDRQVAILLGSAVAQEAGDGKLAICFNRESGKRPTQLVIRQLDRLHGLNASWADKV